MILICIDTYRYILSVFKDLFTTKVDMNQSTSRTNLTIMRSFDCSDDAWVAAIYGMLQSELT